MSRAESRLRAYAQAIKSLALDPLLGSLRFDNLDDIWVFQNAASMLRPPDVAQKVTYSTIESNTIASQAARIEKRLAVLQQPVSSCPTVPPGRCIPSLQALAPCAWLNVGPS